MGMESVVCLVGNGVRASAETVPGVCPRDNSTREKVSEIVLHLSGRQRGTITPDKQWSSGVTTKRETLEKSRDGADVVTRPTKIDEATRAKRIRFRKLEP